MQNKSSAHYQRLYRQRLRERGLIKKEVWVLPEYASQLMACERQWRQPRSGLALTDREGNAMQQIWTAKGLYEALATTELFTSAAARLELIDGSEPSLHITMCEYGELPLFLAVHGEQIIVEALLWPASDVEHQGDFNAEVLRTQKLFPLSCIGLETLADGELCYTMFGALSSSSSLADVVFEMELLADNVIKATEAYEGHLKATA